MLFSLICATQANAADTTIKGTGATSATAGLEVTNSSDTSLLYVRNDGNVGIGTTGPNNLLSVYQLIDFNKTDHNTKLGYQAGLNIVAGAINNTFIGYQTGMTSSTASTDTADYNTAIGYQALYSNTTGNTNSAMGNGALVSNTTGNYNSAMGYEAGRYIANGTTANQTSNNSLYLGYDTRALANGDTNEIVIGASAIGVGSNSVVLGNNSITKTILKGNVGIGTTSPNAVALLDVSSTTKGFLPPRMTTTQRDAITTPPAGLMIYNTTTNKLNFYNGTAWEAVTSA